MDEASLKQSLELYRSQLNQIEQTLQAAGNNDELLQLKQEMTELIHLTEEGLLSFMKSKMLQELDNTTPSSTCTSGIGSISKEKSSTSIDEEYAAFEASLAEDENDTVINNDLSPDNSAPTPLLEQLESLVGMKCRAPFQQAWGSSSYFNAMVTGVEEMDSTVMVPNVMVMFCNPTCTKMLPCQFHLEGRCKFDGKTCKYSHGHKVDVEDLKEFKEPDYSTLRMGSACLARYDDDLWYRATVVDILDNHKFTIKFDNYKDISTVDMAEILPLDSSSEESSDKESEEEDLSQSSVMRGIEEDDDDNDDLPVYLWKPPKTTEALGQWEAHTKGIASKLMAKMGYVIGQGLGKNGEGRAEPVPIQLIPQGKSLDKIMALKEIAGDQDLFDVMKRNKRKTVKTEKKNEKNYKKKASSIDVFDFINKKLGGKRGDVKSLVPRHLKEKKEPTKHISERDLHAKSDRNINVQLFKTHEEMKNTERELVRLKQGLSRNENKDKGAAERIRQKIRSTEEYLEKLKSSEKAMENHKQKRSDRKKLTIF